MLKDGVRGEGSWPQLISVTMRGGDSNRFTSYIQVIQQIHYKDEKTGQIVEYKSKT